MKKSSKKLLTQTTMAVMICTVTMFGSNFRASSIELSDRERAARVQQSEFAKYRYSDRELVKSEIESNEEEIKALEKDCREVLDSELAYLLQVEEDLKVRIENCIWWGWEYWNLDSQLYSVRRNINLVKSKINANNEKIERLKKVRKNLDEEYAIFLQNQEIYAIY